VENNEVISSITSISLQPFCILDVYQHYAIHTNALDCFILSDDDVYTKCFIQFYKKTCENDYLYSSTSNFASIYKM